MSKKDKLFDNDKKVGDFAFDSKTVEVFDDMLERSVPFYSEVQRMMAEIVKQFYIPGTNIYDLGCSTGTTMFSIANGLDIPAKFIGCDYSEPMLKKAKAKIENADFKNDHKFEYKQFDFNENFELKNASAVIMNLTMQFVRPINRSKVVKIISNGLVTGGTFILVEKVLCSSSIFNRVFIDLYLSFKMRMGYSQLEIAKKREALENVLVPYRTEENITLLRDTGFQSIEIFFKWYDWVGLVALK